MHTGDSTRRTFPKAIDWENKKVDYLEIYNQQNSRTEVLEVHIVAGVCLVGTAVLL